MELPLLNSKFENVGKYQVKVSLEPDDIKVPVVHQVVKSLLANRRQGNACTKTKALVQGGGKKPFKQKGTGRARQGSTRSPLMVGGGTIFGPTPRDFTQKINKKMMLKALQSVLADKHQAGKLTIVDSFKSSGKTKEIYQTLNSKGLLPGLVIANDQESLVIRAMKNLKNGKAIAAEGFSVYEALKYENLIMEKGALDKILARLG